MLVTIPADALSATLQYHVYPVSGEATPAAQRLVLGQDTVAGGDAQYLLLLDPDSGDVLEELFWQLSNAQQWQPYRFDLTGYAGRTVKLHFGVYNDAGGGRTGMFVDNASLVVQRPSLPEQRDYLPIVARNHASR